MTLPAPATEVAPPTVSVIVATYNSAVTLKPALQSLAKQDFHDFEVWVIGDGCRDDSEDIVRDMNDSRLRWHNLPVNSGSQSAPNNEGLRRARGTYVAYLGHDDLWLPWHLSDLLAAMADGGGDFVSATALLLHPDGTHRVTGLIGTGRSHADQYTPPSGWLHRRDIADRIGGWRDPGALRCGVDLDFQRRVALAGCKCGDTTRLSVLKFPSAWWRNYAHDREPPQPHWLRRIENDPTRLERELLQEVMMTNAREQNGARPLPALRQAAQALLRRIADCYGRDHWPVSTFMYWRQQRFRRSDRPRRGLPPLDR